MTEEEFLSAIDDQSLTMLDRALALLWLRSTVGENHSTTANELCSCLETIGYPRQNVSRMNAALSKSRMASRDGKDRWRLHPRGRAELDSAYSAVVKRPKIPPKSDSVLPIELFTGTRGYIERVAFQLNASYDATLYDCCAVMCRRLLETLIIEVYEKAGRADEIKTDDGNFLMLNGLVLYLESDKSFNLSRNSQKGLRDFKTLGDLSAHNRRFNARKSDIDRVRDGLRVATEDLLSLAKMK